MRGVRIVAAAAIGVATLMAGAVPPAAAGVRWTDANGSPRPGGAAAQHKATFLDSSIATVQTTSGHKLHLTISAFVGNRGESSASVVLSNGVANVLGETHQWSFPLKHSAFTYSSKTGRGKLSTGTQLDQFGVLDLAFKRLSQKTTNCASAGTQTRVKGTLSGEVFFNSKTKWGKLGARKHVMKFKNPNFITLEPTDCGNDGGQGPPPCRQGISWDSPVSNSLVSFFGSDYKVGPVTSPIIDVGGSTDLRKPKNASRFDLLVAKEPAPTLTGQTLHIKTSGSAITGSATLEGSSPAPNSFGCTSGGKNKQETDQNYEEVPWSSSHFTAHFQAISKVTAPSSGVGSFTVSKLH